MAKTKITKKEALDKFQAAREKKRKCLAQLEKSMKETYKERTGKEAENSLLYDTSSFIGTY